MRPPTRLLVTIAAVSVLALVAFAGAVAVVPVRWDARTLVLAALLAGLATVARLYPLQLAPKTKVFVDTAPLFAAVILVPVPVAMALGALIASASGSIRRVRWFQTLFNTAQTALAMLAGATVFEAVAGTDQLKSLDPGRWMLAAPLAGAALYFTNAVLVETIVAVQLRRSPFRHFWRRRQVELPQEGALFLLGLLVAALGVQHPWTVVLLVLPSAVAHRALREGVALRVQTRAALEELADMIDLRDRYTSSHSRRVAALAVATAQELGLSADEVETIELAARLHDVGKIGIKSSILMKPGNLTSHEWREMHAHPEVGARLLGKLPTFDRGRELVLAHHERFNGSGYPRGLAGEHIPLGARIIAVADAWDAMMSHRSYRRAVSLERAYAELGRGRGTQFDPRVLDAFLRMLAASPELARPQPHPAQEVDDLVAGGVAR